MKFVHEVLLALSMDKIGYRISANSFRTCMYCDKRSHYIRLNSKKNSFRGNCLRYTKFSNLRLVFVIYLGLGTNQFQKLVWSLALICFFNIKNVIIERV